VADEHSLANAVWVVVYASRHLRDCEERGLVLEALGIPHLTASRFGESSQLLVPADRAEQASQQLAAFLRENKPAVPTPAVPWDPISTRLAALYVGLLLGGFWLQHQLAIPFDWTATTALTDGVWSRGEWWRVITALTVHADAGHVLANLVVGLAFILLCGRYLGAGFAGLTVLLVAVAANAIESALLPPLASSVGASTAVFAALGLAAGLAWAWQSRHRLAWPHRWAPLVGGAVMLTYLGTGDSSTDTLAHLLGFGGGLIAGAAIATSGGARWRSRRWQHLAGWLAMLVVVSGWLSAWSQGITSI
jgi:rhomboid protease GluP